MPGRAGKREGEEKARRRPSGELPAGDPVRERLEALRGNPDVRWHMSKHTLELAIGALEAEGAGERPSSSKSRRRRRRKRFL